MTYMEFGKQEIDLFLIQQINFSDKVMKNKKLSFENSINIAKDMIKAVKKYNGFITFEFNISNFTEIPYLKKFFSI